MSDPRAFLAVAAALFAIGLVGLARSLFGRGGLGAALLGLFAAFAGLALSAGALARAAAGDAASPAIWFVGLTLVEALAALALALLARDGEGGSAR